MAGAPEGSGAAWPAVTALEKDGDGVSAKRYSRWAHALFDRLIRTTMPSPVAMRLRLVKKR